EPGALCSVPAPPGSPVPVHPAKKPLKEVCMNLMKASLLASALALGLGTALSTAAADDSRKLGQVIDDATVTASVKTRLLDDERTQGLAINVSTQNGAVAVTGG